MGNAQIKKPSAFQLGLLPFLREAMMLQLQKGPHTGEAGSRDLRATSFWALHEAP